MKPSKIKGSESYKVIVHKFNRLTRDIIAKIAENILVCRIGSFCIPFRIPHEKSRVIRVLKSGLSFYQDDL